MQNNTIFSNDYVSISGNGIDLTRSRFPYKHIPFEEIDDVKIEEGYLIRNRNAVLVFCAVSIILLVMFLLQSNLFNNLFAADNRAGLIIIATRPVLAVLVVLAALTYLLYQSFAKSRVMTIKTHRGQFSVRLNEVKDDQQEQTLRDFLKKQMTGFPGTK